jgi:hypothetical protein
LPKSQADTAVQVVREIAEGREGRAELVDRAVPDARVETLAEGLMVVTAEGGTYAIPTTEVAYFRENRDRSAVRRVRDTPPALSGNQGGSCTREAEAVTDVAT